MGERISDDELRRLLTVSEGSNYPLAFRAAGQLGEIAHALAAEVLQLREALRPFAEPHAMGDQYVRFSPALISNARAALSDTMKQEGR